MRVFVLVLFVFYFSTVSFINCKPISNCMQFKPMICRMNGGAIYGGGENEETGKNTQNRRLIHKKIRRPTIIFIHNYSFAAFISFFRVIFSSYNLFNCVFFKLNEHNKIKRFNKKGREKTQLWPSFQLRNVDRCCLDQSMTKIIVRYTSFEWCLFCTFK